MRALFDLFRHCGEVILQQLIQRRHERIAHGADEGGNIVGDDFGIAVRGAVGAQGDELTVPVVGVRELFSCLKDMHLLIHDDREEALFEVGIAGKQGDERQHVFLRL